MYPGQTTFDSQSREFAYSDGAVCLCLRLPAAYPEAGFPDVILAADGTKSDLRAQTTTAVRELRLAEDDAKWSKLKLPRRIKKPLQPANQRPLTTLPQKSNKTVIIYTNKRKLALCPAHLIPSCPWSHQARLPGNPGLLRPGFCCIGSRRHTWSSELASFPSAL